MTADPSAPDVAVSTSHLDCGYGEHVVVHDVELRLPKGRITCILGASGSGKSTLLRTLLLLQPPLAGSVIFGDTDITGLREGQLDDLRRRIGVLFQGAALFTDMTLQENVAFPLVERTRLPRSLAMKVALVKLELVDLADSAGLFPEEISGGMAKRGGIARALALDPEFLFLDEPGAGLDPITSASLDRLIIHIRDTLGTTMVMVSHELASIQATTDHLVMLGDGRVRAQGPAQEIMASDDEWIRGFFDRKLPPETELPTGGLAALLLPEESHET